MGVSITTIAATDKLSDSRSTINTNFSNIATDLDGFTDALKNLTTAEIGQLENIGTTTISAAQWGYLGACTTAGGAILDDADASAQRTTLGLVIGTDVQASDAGLTSLAGLTYVSDSFIKVTATDTYAIRTLAETKTDLSLNLVENTALSTWAGTTNITTLGTISTGTWSATDIAVAAGGTGSSTAAGARTNLGLVIGTNVQAEDPVLTDLAALTAVSGADQLIVSTGAGAYAHEAASTLPATIGGVIQDLDTLGAAGSDGQFIVATGAGAFAYESGSTARTSLGLGTTNTPQFLRLGIGAAADGTDELYIDGTSRYTGNLTRIGLADNPSIIIETYSVTDSHTGYFQFRKSGQSTEGYSTTATGEDLGIIRFYGVGGDADAWNVAAQIKGEQDAAAQNNGVPGRMIFYTTTDAEPGVVTEALRLDSSQNATFAGTISVAPGNVYKQLELIRTAGAWVAMYFTDATGTAQIYGGAGGLIFNTGATALTLDSSQNATFAGDIEIGAGGTLGIDTAPVANTPIKHLLSSGSSQTILFQNDSTGEYSLKMDADVANANDGIAFWYAYWNNTNVAAIYMTAGSDTTNKDDGEINFRTAAAGTLLQALNIGNDQVATFSACLVDGTCWIFDKEDALSIISDIYSMKTKEKDEYGHYHQDMKKIYQKYPYLIHKTKIEKEMGKGRKDFYGDKLGAKSDLLYKAVLQLKDENDNLKKRIKVLENK